MATQLRHQALSTSRFLGSQVRRNFQGFFEADGTVTTLTAALQIALDGQSFADYIVAANFISAAAKQKVFAPTSSTPMIAGATYRINITVASGSFNTFVGFN